MSHLTKRTITAEHMDEPGIDRGELAMTLRFIRFVNRRLGGAGAALRHLARWSRGWPVERPLRILDVATGSADIPLAIAEWARRAGRRVHITAIDRHPTTLALAREHVGEREDITLLQADALRLTDQFAVGEFDVVHAGMFLHHLDDIQVITVLAIMDKLASRGIIWNDLVRGPIEKGAVRLMTFGLPAHARHDAVVSVEAGFTRQEALDLARRAGVRRPTFHRHLFGRFTLTSLK